LDAGTDCLVDESSGSNLARLSVAVTQRPFDEAKMMEGPFHVGVFMSGPMQRGCNDANSLSSRRNDSISKARYGDGTSRLIFKTGQNAF